MSDDKPAGKTDLEKPAATKAADPGPKPPAQPSKPAPVTAPGRPSAAPFFAKVARAVEKTWVQFLVLLPLLSFISLGLTYGTMNTCFQLVVVPLVVLVIPYYFGLKKVKRLLVLGVLALLFSGVMWGVVDSHCLSERKCGYDWNFVESNEFQPLPADERAIVMGTVDPITSGAPLSFHFSLIVNHSKLATMNRTVFDVLVRVADYGDVVWGTVAPLYNRSMIVDNKSNPNAVLYVNDTVVERSATLLTKFLLVTRSIANPNQYFYEETFTLVAPVTAKPVDLYPKLVPNRAILSVAIFGVVLLFMLSILWWSRKAREKREEMEKQFKKMEEEEKKSGKPAGKESDFACTACGAGVSDSDSKCPSCGAVFEDDSPAGKEEKPVASAPAKGDDPPKVSGKG